MGLFLLFVLIFFVVGGLPYWNYHSYGYHPSGISSIILLVVIVLLLMGKL